MCSQIIALSLQGIPGIYIHNFIATPNYLKGVAESGEKRMINRKEWTRDELEQHLKGDTDIGSKVLERYKDVLKVRKQHPAFSPEAKQEVLKLGNDFFALRRISESENEEIICISNITCESKSVSSEELKPFTDGQKMKDLLNRDHRSIHPELELESFETVWLKR
jgi:sucrose phosphorylase